MSKITEGMSTKDMTIDGFKILDETEGIIEAYVSGIGNKDSGNDIIVPGAFDKYLTKRTPKGVWSHDWDKPIAKTLAIEERPAGDSRLPVKMKAANIGGLYVKCQFNLNTTLGRDAYENVKFFGEDSEWSIGYRTHEKEYDTKQGANILKELELFEYSPVLFGMNELTATTSVKAHMSTTGEIDIDVTGLPDETAEAVKAAVNAVLEASSPPEEKSEEDPREGQQNPDTPEITPEQAIEAAVDQANEDTGTEEAPDDEKSEKEDEIEVKDETPAIQVKAVAGSYEERFSKIEDALRAAFITQETDDGETCCETCWMGYIYTVATFDTHVVYYQYDYDNNEQNYYDVSYIFESDGNIVLGTPKPVDVMEVIVAKSAIADVAKSRMEDVLKKELNTVGFEWLTATEEPEEKAGRKLSASNQERLQSAVDTINEVLGTTVVVEETDDDEKSDESEIETTEEAPEGEKSEETVSEEEATEEVEESTDEGEKSDESGDTAEVEPSEEKEEISDAAFLVLLAEFTEIDTILL